MSTFYPLKNDEWSEVRQNLKPVEIVILYHLRTLDPFGVNVTRLNITELAKELKINRSTASRALKKLDRDGYIKMQLHEVSVALNTVIKNCTEPQTKPKARSRDRNNGECPTLKVCPADHDINLGVCSTDHEVRSLDHGVCSTDHSLRSPDHTNGSQTQSESEFQKPLDLLDQLDYKDQIDREICLNVESDGNTKDETESTQPQTVKLDQPSQKKSDFASVKSTVEKIVSDCTAAPKPKTKSDRPENVFRPIEIAEDDSDRDLKIFIMKEIEKKGHQIEDWTKYLKTIFANSRNYWEKKYVDSLRSKPKQHQERLDLRDVEQTIAMSMTRDPEFAIARFNQYPEFQEQILEKYPEWSQQLTGIKREPRNQTDINIEKMRGRLAMLQGRLRLPFLQPLQRLETETEIRLLKDLLSCP